MTSEVESLAQRIIAHIFANRFEPGMSEVAFRREDLVAAAEALGEERPKNLGDVIYSLRYRIPLPNSIQQLAPANNEWAIFPGGSAVYVLRVVPFNLIVPRTGMRAIRLPDSTPGVIARYAMSDEQALLALLRYNRLLEIFTGLACYHLQSHLRTSVTVRNAIDGSNSASQVETDDLYVGLDQHGSHHVLPVQAKGGTDALSVIQIWQDFRVAEQKFPDLIVHPIAAQFVVSGEIALFEFEESHNKITIAREKHYQLVPPDQLTAEELHTYNQATNRSLK